MERAILEEIVSIAKKEFLLPYFLTPAKMVTKNLKEREISTISKTSRELHIIIVKILTGSEVSKIIPNT